MYRDKGRISLIYSKSDFGFHQRLQELGKDFIILMVHVVEDI